MPDTSTPTQPACVGQVPVFGGVPVTSPPVVPTLTAQQIADNAILAAFNKFGIPEGPQVLSLVKAGLIPNMTVTGAA
jgi:hypothetical protein